RIARAPHLWVVLAAVFTVAGTLAALLVAIIPSAPDLSPLFLGTAGTVLILAPVVILRRIAANTHISGETILGAVCVYLLYGMSFAYLFILVGTLTPGGFFQEQAPTRLTSDFLFFSYTTLTTVGYGNLIPAGALGQALSMVEALLGQIYLVVIVARAVSLWGQERPAVGPRQHSAPQDPAASSDDTGLPRTDALASMSLEEKSHQTDHEPHRR